MIDRYAKCVATDHAARTHARKSYGEG